MTNEENPAFPFVILERSEETHRNKAAVAYHSVTITPIDYIENVLTKIRIPVLPVVSQHKSLTMECNEITISLTLKRDKVNQLLVNMEENDI